MTLRSDLALIADMVPPQSRVLDLGCGDGELLDYLTRDKGCTGTGVDFGSQEFVEALRRGVNVIDLDLNSELDEFSDHSYDVVVLSRTLQNVERPREVLTHIRRIAAKGIVSMPNFAYWRNRISLAVGRMPISRDLPFEWYDTPNIHYTSLHELEPLFEDLGFSIERRVALAANGKPLTSTRWTNALAGSAVYLLACTS